MRVLCLAAFRIFVILIALATSVPLVSAGPLTRDELLELLGKNVDERRIAEVVKELGVDFTLSDELLARLQRAGAGTVIAALVVAPREAGLPPLSPAGQERSSGSPRTFRPQAIATGPAIEFIADDFVPSSAPVVSPAPVALALKPAESTSAETDRIPVGPPPLPRGAPASVPPKQSTSAETPAAVGRTPAPSQPPTPSSQVAAVAPSPPSSASARGAPGGRDCIKPFLDQAERLSKESDYRAAIRALVEGLKCDPGNVQATKLRQDLEQDLVDRAERFLADSQLQRASKDFRFLIDEVNPELSAAHDGMGRTHLAMKNYSEAVLAFERALEIDPNNVRYKKQRDDAKRAQEVEEELKMQPLRKKGQ